MRVFKSISSFLSDVLFPPRDSEVLVRKTSVSELLSHMNARVVEIRVSGGVLIHCPIVALFSYAVPVVQASILEAKFHNNIYAAHLLAHALRRYLISSADDRPLCFLPIPLSAKRRAERGYNQTERVASHAVAHLNTLQLACTNVTTSTELLIRTKDTRPQMTLTREARLTNVLGAFTVMGVPNPNVNYVVFDDVTTTGSTLHAAELTLREAGAKYISLLALAH